MNRLFINKYPGLVCLTVFVWLLETSYGLFIENFQNLDISSAWHEISDSRFNGGHSVSSLKVLPPKEGGPSAVLFTLLVPCERNASFAGIVKLMTIDLSEKTNIILKVKGQGDYLGYEFILRHNGDNGDTVPSYVHYFNVPKDDIEEIILPIAEFKAYKQGQSMPNHVPLNKKNITALGILAYGGKYRKEKQIGVAALQIEWIRSD